MLLWGLLLTNLMAIGIGARASLSLVTELGGAPRGSLGFVLNPAVIVAVMIDGCDAVALAFLLLFLVAFFRKQIALAMLWAALAGLTKEPSLLAVACVALFARDFRPSVRLANAFMPAAIVALWGLYVRFRFGFAPQVAELGLPLKSYFQGWMYWWPARDATDALAATAAIALAVIVIVRFIRRRTMLMSAALPYAVMVPFLSFDVMSLMHNIARAFAPALTFLFIDFYTSRRH